MMVGLYQRAILNNIKKIIAIMFIAVLVYKLNIDILSAPVSLLPEPDTKAMLLEEIARFGKGGITDLEVSPNGEFVAVGSPDMFWIYQLDGLELISFQEKHVDQLNWSPDGKRLAIAYEQKISIWDPFETQMLMFKEFKPGTIQAMSWSTNGEYLAVECWQGDIYILNSVSLQTLKTLHTFFNSVDSIAWSPDDKTVFIAGGWLGNVESWSVENERKISFFEGSEDSSYGISISPDGTKIVSGSHEDYIKVWDIRNPKDAVTIPVENGDYTKTVQWSPDGKNIAVVNNSILIFNYQSNEYIFKLSYISDNKHFSWYPDGSGFVITGPNGSLQSWDMDKLEKREEVFGFTGQIEDISWSPDGQWLATGGTDGIVRVWDTTTWQIEKMLFWEDYSIKRVAWSPDNKKIAIYDRYGTLSIVDVKTWKTSSIIEDSCSCASYNKILWAPDSQRIAIGGDLDQVHIWNIGTGLMELELNTKPYGVNSMSWSPDLKYLVTGHNDGKLMVWDTTTGRAIRKFLVVGSYVSWSPHNDYLAAMDDVGNLRIFDTNNWIIVQRANLFYSQCCVEMTWSPNGTFLTVSDSPRGLSRIWHVNNRKVLTEIDGIEQFTWSPDETKFATTIGNGLINIYKITN